MVTAPPRPALFMWTGISSPLHPGVAHARMWFNCLMNSSNLVKSMKQTLCGTIAACILTLSLTILSGVGKYRESSPDRLNDSLRQMSLVSLEISCTEAKADCCKWANQNDDTIHVSSGCCHGIQLHACMYSAKYCTTVNHNMYSVVNPKLTHIHTRTHTHKHTCTHTLARTHVHTHTHTRSHACMHTHIHTHTLLFFGSVFFEIEPII